MSTEEIPYIDAQGRESTIIFDATLFQSGEVVPLHLSAPKRYDSQWIIPLEGVIAAFLRVTYIVQPVELPDWALGDEEGGVRTVLEGVVHPEHFEYLVADGLGDFATLDEWSINVRGERKPPASLRELEDRNRPSAEQLGYTKSDLAELRGE